MMLLRSLLFDLLFYSWMLIMGVVCAPAALASRNATYWIMRLYSRQMLWLLRVLCGTRHEIRGSIPDYECIIAAKHQSFLDIIMIMAYVPRPKFVMKKELKWAPILGWYGMRIGATPVDRGKGSRTIEEMSQQLGNQRKEKGQIIIYPQGTRVAPGVRGKYKVGAGVLYQRFNLPCVPSATNVGLFWARKSLYRKPGLAVIEFLDPIPAGLKIPEFMPQIEKQIESASDALMEEAGYTRLPMEPVADAS